MNKRLLLAIVALVLLSGSVLAAEEPPAAWLAEAQRQIAEAEYEISRQGETLQAPNRAQGFRTHFTETGIRVVPRSEETPAWTWELRFAHLGRGPATQLSEVPVLATRANRVEYRRGNVEEWYVNDARGLKHGFTLSRRPEGRGALALTLVLQGDLSPRISEDGQAIDFVTGSGARALRYAELLVNDATGRVLPSRMEGWNANGARGIRIVIDDAKAVWPLTVDPLLTGPPWTAESDQSSAQFGFSVAPAGDVNGDGFSDVIIGAFAFDAGSVDEGRAFVYHGTPSGLSLTPSWTAESNAANVQFARSVNTAGDVNGDGYADVIVGAYLLEFGPQPDEGRAFVYHGSAAGLSATANWSGESNQPSALFGLSVGPAGDVNGDGFSDVIVGAPNMDNGQSDEGRAFVYHGSASGLSLASSWSGEANQASARFGYSVGTAGDVNGDGYSDVVVGAYLFDNMETDEGRAYVFHGSASGLSSTAAWTAESDQLEGNFSVAVGTAGDVNGDGYADVIVGAYLFDSGEADEGKAFVYHGSASGLSTTASWTAESDQVGAQLRYVSTAGDVNGDGYSDVIVGAYLFDNGEADEGRVYVYRGSAAGLATTAAWTAEGDQISAQFGVAASTAGDVNGDGYSDVIVGAYLFDNGQTDEGKAFVYHGAASGLSAIASWVQDGEQADSILGYSVASAGDVDGDGYGDVLVGSPGFDAGETNEGRAQLFRGSPTGLSTLASWTVDGEEASALFGLAVAGAGDVNGDGYADVVIGAPGHTNGELEEGSAFVYHGSPGGLATIPSWTAPEPNNVGAYLGYAVGTAGDVNGDGYADVIVTAPFFTDGEEYEGRAWVYHGSPTGVSAAPSWSIVDANQVYALLGYAAGTAGDVNGDGYADVIVTVPYFSNGEIYEGVARVYHGSAAGLALTPAWIGEANLEQANYGYAAGTAGDVNGDGYADVIVATPAASLGESFEGVAYVYHGSGTGLSTTPAWTAEGNAELMQLGYSAGTAGDVNGDGYADVIVGASGFRGLPEDPKVGAALMYLGAPTGLAGTPGATVLGEQDSADFGRASACAGDVNGDGFADVIVGAVGYDGAETSQGRAYVFLGGGGGVSLRPQQRRADNTAPIAQMGTAASRNQARLSVIGRSPAGRGRVKLEWEVKELGTPLDGTGLQSTAGWSDTGTAGVVFDELLAGLDPGTVYHWRLRFVYPPAQQPFLAHGRWITVPVSGAQEGDFRTAVLVDLSVAQSDGTDPLLLGSANLVYTLTVSNAGPDAAPVVLADTLPAGATFVSAVPSQGSCAPPAGGVVTCSLGSLGSGGNATVVVTVSASAPGDYTNAASVTGGLESNAANNTSQEVTTVAAAQLGDRVWEDSDADGLQDPGEPGVADVIVALYDGAGLFVDATVTDSSGAYSFPGLTVGATYRVRVLPPASYVLTLKDQGGNDLLDSDVDPTTQLTPASTLASGHDPVRWDAGLLPSCVAPDEPIYISTITMTTENYPVLHFQDPNQSVQVTGYNVYRASNPSLPPGSWTLVASDIVDMDQGTPNRQWVDTTGGSGTWYYQVTAYNSRCPAEGPR